MDYELKVMQDGEDVYKVRINVNLLQKRSGYFQKEKIISIRYRYFLIWLVDKNVLIDISEHNLKN